MYLPEQLTTAAKVAGLRTAAQSLASAIPTTAIVIQLNLEWWIAALIATASVILTALLSGMAAYFWVISDGLPEPYAPKRRLEE